MNKIKNIFDWIKEITYEKSPPSSFTEDDWGKFSPFLIHRFMSMFPDYIELVDYIQKHQNTPQQIYTIYRELIPKKKAFSKYIGAKSSTPSDLTKNISEYYECSIRDAKDYIELLNKEQLTDILTQQGIVDKELKQILKNDTSISPTKTKKKH